MSFGLSWVGVHLSPPERTAGMPGLRHPLRDPVVAKRLRLVGRHLLRAPRAARAGSSRRAAARSGRGRRRRRARSAPPRAARARARRQTERLVAQVEDVAGHVDASRSCSERRPPSHLDVRPTRAAGRGNGPASRSSSGRSRARTPRPAASPRRAAWRTPPRTSRCPAPGFAAIRVERRRGVDEVGRHRRQDAGVQVDAGPGRVREVVDPAPGRDPLLGPARPGRGDDRRRRRRVAGLGRGDHEPVRVAGVRRPAARPCPGTPLRGRCRSEPRSGGRIERVRQFAKRCLASVRRFIGPRRFSPGGARRRRPRRRP